MRFRMHKYQENDYVLYTMILAMSTIITETTDKWP